MGRRFRSAGLRRSSRRSVVALALALTFAFVFGTAACSSGSKTSTTTTTTAVRPTSTTATAGSTTEATAPVTKLRALPDACKLLTAAQVKAAIGKEAVGQKPPTGGSGGPDYAGCTWGDIASDNPLIAVQVSRPSGAANIDYVKSLVSAVGEPGTPVDIGENGRLLSRAYIPGGGGAGQSIMFTKNGDTVVVGLVRGTSAQLEAAARAVAANIG
jgi:hypothetical protein